LSLLGNGDWLRLIEIEGDWLRLIEIEGDWGRLIEIDWDWLRLIEIDWDWLRLIWDWGRLREIDWDWLRLIEIDVFLSYCVNGNADWTRIFLFAKSGRIIFFRFCLVLLLLYSIKHPCYFNLSKPFCNKIDFKYLAKYTIQFNLTHYLNIRLVFNWKNWLLCGYFCYFCTLRNKLILFWTSAIFILRKHFCNEMNSWHF
jgi:hypothetical protein